jgi:predicted nucleotide-binding protein
MTADELRSFLTQHQVACKEEEVQHGVKFSCTGGEIFIVYKTGKLNLQGKKTGLSASVKEWYKGGSKAPVAAVATAAEAAPAMAIGPDRRVFIVYGHDVASRETLELLLHKMGLEPIVLQDLPAQGDTIIEKLEHYLGEHGNVGYGCVLLTPDDEGHIANLEKEKKYRARQNVVLELGMVLARLGRRRVAILHKASVELPSDIAGLIYISYKERVDEAKMKLYQELKAAGYNPKV